MILLPPHVAADISGLSTKTLARRGAAGKLTVEKRGTHRRYREDEIRALTPGGAA